MTFGGVRGIAMNTEEIRIAAELHAASAADWSDYAVLADAYLSHPYGELKPLEWESHGERFYDSESACGDYRIILAINGEAPQWMCAVPGGAFEKCDSIDHGKQLCQKRYESTIQSLFRRIGDTQ